jgi:hypothetical protein
MELRFDRPRQSKDLLVLIVLLNGPDRAEQRSRPLPESIRHGAFARDLLQQAFGLFQIEAKLDAVPPFAEPGIHQRIELAFGASEYDRSQSTITRRRFPLVLKSTHHRFGSLANDPAYTADNWNDDPDCSQLNGDVLSGNYFLGDLPSVHAPSDKKKLIPAFFFQGGDPFTDSDRR